MTFELSDQSHLLGVAALAKALGVTDQTVYNYEARGMAPVGTSPDGGKLWDPALAKAWIDSNGPSRVKGGKRRGAGAKPKEEKQRRMEERSESTQRDLRQIFDDAERRMLERGVPAEIAKQAGEVQALLDAVKSGEMNIHQVELLEKTIKTVGELLKVRKAEGELVSKSEMKIEFGQHLTVIRRTLESVPSRVAPEIIAELKLGAEMMPAVKQVLREKLAFVMKQLGESDQPSAVSGQQTA